MSKFPTVNLAVSLHNAEDFSNLVTEFSQKARELEEIAHKLTIFRFHGEIEDAVLSNDTNEIE